MQGTNGFLKGMLDQIIWLQQYLYKELLSLALALRKETHKF